MLAVSWDPSGQYVTPTIYQWNLTIERQLTGDWLARASYVATRSTHLNEDVEMNPAVYTPGSALSTDQRRLFQGLASVQQQSNSVNGWYHGLQMSLEKRFSHGLTVLANYTFSKSLDNATLNKNVPSIGVSNYGVLPWYFHDSLMLDRGPSDFDFRHNFVVSYVWQPAVPKGVILGCAIFWKMELVELEAHSRADRLRFWPDLIDPKPDSGKITPIMSADRC